MLSENIEKIPVVVADDHELIRTGLRLVLQDSDQFYISAETERADSLLEIIETKPCEIILLDLHMPDQQISRGTKPDFRSKFEWSGLRLLREIKEKHPDIRVLIITQYEDTVVVHEANKLGVDGFILKNEVNDMVLAALRKVYTREKFFSNRITDILNAPPVLPDQILSPREFEVLELVANGFQDKDICDRLDISRRTVAFHKANIKEKLNVESTAEIIAYYYKYGK